MYQVQQIQAAPNQSFPVTLENGIQMNFDLYFSPMQQCWFITSMTYLGFEVHGLKVSNNPNMLRQWEDLIPFGMACFSQSDREPALLEDFFNGNSKLYILSQDEVSQYTEFLSG